MQAVLCSDFNKSTISEVDRPTVTANDVLVEVDRVQLSVTECALYRGWEVAHYETVKYRLENNNRRLFGHEFCGHVVEVGNEVSSLDIGDRVYAPSKLPCEDCQYCVKGYQHLCTNKQSIGYDRPGALAEYVSLPEKSLSPLPESVSDAEGAAMQPLASALLCTIDGNIESGDVVAVIGAGVMGYQCAQIALYQGARTVYAIDIRPQPLSIVAQQPISPINASDTDPVEHIRKVTNSVGADVVFEAAGGDQSDITTGDDPLAQAHQLVRRGGTIVQVGHIIGDVTMTPRKARSNCVTWVNPRKGIISTGPNTNTGELAPQLVADGSISIKEYTTHDLKGLGAFEKAIDITLNKNDYNALGPAQIVINN